MTALDLGIDKRKDEQEQREKGCNVPYGLEAAHADEDPDGLR